MFLSNIVEVSFEVSSNTLHTDLIVCSKRLQTYYVFNENRVEVLFEVFPENLKCVKTYHVLIKNCGGFLARMSACQFQEKLLPV